MISTDNYNIKNGANSELRIISMLTLATLPILGWYEIPFPVGLGYAIVLFLSTFSIALRGFKINVLPKTFWLVFFYVCFMWLYHHGFGIKLLFPPGGWPFFQFFLALVWGVLTFDLSLLKKFMRWVIIVSAILFWIQFLLKLTTGSFMFCFVPNLTGAFTYEGLSYAELVTRQMNSASGRMSSVFLEPSYMAYYYLTYLAIYWFSNKLKDKWYDRDVIFIVVTLVALKSGTGMLGLAVLGIIKVVRQLFAASLRKKMKYILFTIPVLTAGIYFYVNSEAGQSMIYRSKEFSNAETSGFARAVGGYLMFGQMSRAEQMIGIPDPTQRFGYLKNGRRHLYANGIQTILLTLGYIGMIVYLLFYAGLFRKVSLSSRMCIVVLGILSLLESDYLNAYMILLTIIPCAEYYYYKKSSK